jgi:hypothetical protein
MTRPSLIALSLAVPLLVGPAARVHAQTNPLLDRVSSSPIPAAETVLVAGDPALTRQMVARYTDFMEWIFDTPLNPSQREYIHRMMVRDFRKNDREAIQQCLDALKLEAALGQYTSPQREYLRKKMLPDVVNGARQHADNPDNRWILALYDAAHRPIAPGNPPLTRQASDAFAEFFCFMASEATGKPVQADEKFKTAWAERMRQQYPRLGADAHRGFAEMPSAWAGLKLAWPTLPETEKNRLRNQWRQQLQAMAASAPSTPRRTASQSPMPRRGTPEWQAEYERKKAEYDAYFQETLKQQNALYRQREAYTFLSNLQTINHVGTMNMINTMSGSPYRYTIRYR